ncbi:MAG: glutathione S-transferase family protein [Pseudomonadota bacterium]
MDVTLIGSPFSPYTRAAAVTAIERGVDYTLDPIGPAELRHPGYTEKHPFRRLPALSVDGHRIYETAAIMRYLDSVGTKGASLQPSDPIAQAQSDQWMSAANSYLYAHAFNNFAFMRTFAPAFEITVDEERLADSKERTSVYLAIVNRAIEDGEIGQKQRLTLGDIFAGTILMPLGTFDEGKALLAAQPSAENWIAELSARPGFEQTDAKPGLAG